MAFGVKIERKGGDNREAGNTLAENREVGY
jgi:hypothetical protein